MVATRKAGGSDDSNVKAAADKKASSAADESKKDIEMKAASDEDTAAVKKEEEGDAQMKDESSNAEKDSSNVKDDEANESPAKEDAEMKDSSKVEASKPKTGPKYEARTILRNVQGKVLKAERYGIFISFDPEISTELGILYPGRAFLGGRTNLLSACATRQELSLLFPKGMTVTVDIVRLLRFHIMHHDVSTLAWQDERHPNQKYGWEVQLLWLGDKPDENSLTDIDENQSKVYQKKLDWINENCIKEEPSAFPECEDDKIWFIKSIDQPHYDLVEKGKSENVQSEQTGTVSKLYRPTGGLLELENGETVFFQRSITNAEGEFISDLDDLDSLVPIGTTLKVNYVSDPEKAIFPNSPSDNIAVLAWSGDEKPTLENPFEEKFSKDKKFHIARIVKFDPPTDNGVESGIARIIKYPKEGLLDFTKVQYQKYIEQEDNNKEYKFVKFHRKDMLHLGLSLEKADLSYMFSPKVFGMDTFYCYIEELKEEEEAMETNTEKEDTEENKEEAEKKEDEKDDAKMDTDDDSKKNDDLEKSMDDSEKSKDDSEKSKDDSEKSKDDSEKSKDDSEKSKDDSKKGKDDSKNTKEKDSKKSKDSSVQAKRITKRNFKDGPQKPNYRVTCGWKASTSHLHSTGKSGFSTLPTIGIDNTFDAPAFFSYQTERFSCKEGLDAESYRDIIRGKATPKHLKNEEYCIARVIQLISPIEEKKPSSKGIAVLETGEHAQKTIMFEGFHSAVFGKPLRNIDLQWLLELNDEILVKVGPPYKGYSPGDYAFKASHMCIGWPRNQEKKLEEMTQEERRKFFLYLETHNLTLKDFDEVVAGKKEPRVYIPLKRDEHKGIVMQLFREGSQGATCGMIKITKGSRLNEMVFFHRKDTWVLGYNLRNADLTYLFLHKNEVSLECGRAKALPKDIDSKEFAGRRKLCANLVWTTKFRPRNDIEKKVKKSDHVDSWLKKRGLSWKQFNKLVSGEMPIFEVNLLPQLHPSGMLTPNNVEKAHKTMEIEKKKKAKAEAEFKKYETFAKTFIAKHGVTPMKLCDAALCARGPDDPNLEGMINTDRQAQDAFQIKRALETAIDHYKTRQEGRNARRAPPGLMAARPVPDLVAMSNFNTSPQPVPAPPQPDRGMLREYEAELSKSRSLNRELSDQLAILQSTNREMSAQMAMNSRPAPREMLPPPAPREMLGDNITRKWEMMSGRRSSDFTRDEDVSFRRSSNDFGGGRSSNDFGRRSSNDFGGRSSSNYGRSSDNFGGSDYGVRNSLAQGQRNLIEQLQMGGGSNGAGMRRDPSPVGVYEVSPRMAERGYKRNVYEDSYSQSRARSPKRMRPWM